MFLKDGELESPREAPSRWADLGLRAGWGTSLRVLNVPPMDCRKLAFPVASVMSFCAVGAAVAAWTAGLAGASSSYSADAGSIGQQIWPSHVCAHKRRSNVADVRGSLLLKFCTCTATEGSAYRPDQGQLLLPQMECLLHDIESKGGQWGIYRFKLATRKGLEGLDVLIIKIG